MRTAALALFCLSAPAFAGDPPREIVRKVLAATDAAERAKLVDELVAAKPDPREAAKWFAEGRAYAADAPKGWLDRTVRGGDGKERPYILYVPEDYTPEKRYLFLVDLHGGVSRPLLGHRELEQMTAWADLAEDEGYFLAVPAGERGAEWWTAVGSGNVLSILLETRRAYNVDENRVFVTGFSDGGSGSFYLALTAPTPLAGAVPLNGSLPVAQAGGLQVHLRNLVNVPMYAVNTANDQLYPSVGMKPLFDALKELGARVTWRDVEGHGHDLGYLPEERPAIAAWMWDLRRDPQPRTVVWEGTAPGRVRWLAVTELGKTATEAPFPDVNPKLPPGRVRIGVVIDQAFEGPGLRVAEVQDGMPAAGIGIQAGDVIVGFDGKDVGELPQLAGLLRAKSFGDAFTIRLRRGEETVEKEGKFPDARPEEAFERGKPCGSIAAEVKEGAVVDVRASGVRAFELYLGEPLFDLAKPVTVRVNGETLHSGVVAPDLRFLAEQAAIDGDRTMVYLARLKVSVK
jgi:predicted esterase